MENTSSNNRSQPENEEEIEKSLPFRFRGLPSGVLCRSRDAREELGMSRPVWDRWVLAGLPVSQPGTAAEMVFTDDVIEFVRKHRDLPKPKKRKQTR